MADKMEELSLRIEKIESLMEKVVAERVPTAAADLTVEEIAAFKKVRDVVALDVEKYCGINDCFRCIVVRCDFLCERLCGGGNGACDVECSCGPCALGGNLRGRINRFGNLG